MIPKRSIGIIPPMNNPLHDCIDQLLLEQGTYTPLNLLLAKGQLDYSDYEAWRSGNIPHLEAVLFGDPEQISQMLTQAKAYVTALKLAPKLLTYNPWGSNSSQTLSFSQNLTRAELFHTRYGKAEEQAQLDLFMDATASNLANRTAQALINRDSDEARRLIQLLFDADPDHSRLGSLERLTEADQLLQSPIGNPAARLDQIENELTPLAEDELGSGSHNLLVPHWRHLTTALHGHSFDPKQPKLHASYTASRAFEWQQAITAIQAEPGWQQQLDLLWRYAKACEQLHDKPTALHAYFQLCWQFPNAADAIGRRAAPPQQLAWNDFLALEPELPNELFPAWYLMRHPGLIHQLPQPNIEHQLTSIQTYQIIYSLHQKTTPDTTALNAISIPLRRKLQQLSPVLFVHYMQTKK
ncbi:MAG: hypothetical protein L3J26_07745 [Candidatus Polarisedimenticolaceae bacterium]|nr:hypothetical protein [Candidatus Polarisedimenticolaceae bacterium]